MSETIIASLSVAFITSLAVVAYRHPPAYSKISKTLNRIALLIVLMIFAYNWGVVKAYESILKHLDSQKKMEIIRTLESVSLPQWTTLIIFAGFLVYNGFLEYLPNLLKDDKKSKPK
jgi:hypothetical protein